MLKTFLLILYIATPEVPVPTPAMTEVKSIEECIQQGSEVLRNIERAGANEQYRATFACQIFQRNAETAR